MEFSIRQKNNSVMIYLWFEYLAFYIINGVVSKRCRQNWSTKCHSVIKMKDKDVIKTKTKRYDER